MAVKFALYSTEIAATLDPWNASPAPATMIDFDEDPIFGDYDPEAGVSGRGSRIRTLGGAVDQDFGSFPEDGAIKLSVQDAYIPAATMAALKTAFETVDGEYRFTDSVNCWKVRFAKPDGCKIRRNLFWKSAKNADIFSYDLILNVVSKDI